MVENVIRVHAGVCGTIQRVWTIYLPSSYGCGVKGSLLSFFGYERVIKGYVGGCGSILYESCGKSFSYMTLIKNISFLSLLFFLLRNMFVSG